MEAPSVKMEAPLIVKPETGGVEGAPPVAAPASLGGAMRQVDDRLSETEVWLVKTPQHLYQRWLAAYKDTSVASVPVGTLDVDASGKMTFHVTTNGNASAKEETLQLGVRRAKFEQRVWSEEVGTGALRLEGKVTYQGDLKAPMNADLLDRIRAQTAAENKPQSSSVVLTKAARSDHLAKRARDVKKTLAEQKARKERKRQKGRMNRMEPDQMKSLLFKLFTQQPAWTMTQLKSATEQSADTVKTALHAIAEYNNSERKWYLKAMYQTNTEAMQTDANDEE